MAIGYLLNVKIFPKIILSRFYGRLLNIFSLSWCHKHTKHHYYVQNRLLIRIKNDLEEEYSKHTNESFHVKCWISFCNTNYIHLLDL